MKKQIEQQPNTLIKNLYRYVGDWLMKSCFIGLGIEPKGENKEK